eukprot:TRINITY_DN16789_c0_g1_i1.p1 TRINITY_DN16789_c0_g1~~TRINITY_DN16789_c0_g1_i1.p1  ORF type:complete len:430 (+),score=124.27 TRINITY_DN16789_c0_g1_i1:175-1464(+)
MGNSSSNNNPQENKIEKDLDPLVDYANATLESLKNPKNLLEKELKAELFLENDRSNQKMIDCEENNILVEPVDNSEYPYNYERLEVPKDEEGYVVAFEVSQGDEIKEFFDKYGVVVVKNVVTEEDCNNSVEEFWDFLERHNKGLDRNNKASWTFFWPSLAKMGICGNTIICSQQMFKNRLNINVHKTFSYLFGHDQLWVNLGRINLMRPTIVNMKQSEIELIEKMKKETSRKDIFNLLEEYKKTKFEEDPEKQVEMEKWKTISEWLHWDMQPHTGKATTFSWKVNDRSANRGYDLLKVQGILAVVDCSDKEGGFHCVPGFQHHIRGWANHHPKLFDNKQRETTVQVPQDDPMRKDIQTMPIRKGSLLIWNTKLPHGNFPNSSNKPRMIQYIKMRSSKDPSILPFCDSSYLPEGLELDDREKKLLGIEKY